MVSDLMNGECICKVHRRVQLIPAITVCDQIEASENRGECSVQIEVKRQESGAADQLQECRIPLKGDRAARLCEPRKRSQVKEAEVHDVVALLLRVPKCGIRVFHIREAEDATTDTKVVLLAGSRQLQLTSEEIYRHVYLTVSR